MKFEGHLNDGIVVELITLGVTTIVSLNAMTGVVCGLVALVMSLYPDLDVASKPSRYAFIVGIPAILYFIYVGAYLQAVLTFLLIATPKAFPHRGLVHTLKFGMGATACLYFIIDHYTNAGMILIGGAGMLGYMTHLILDNHIKF